MARVPTVSLSSVKTERAPVVFQSAQGATADAFGAAQGRALEQGGRSLAAAGDPLGKIALKEQIEDNEREAKTLDVEFSAQRRGLLFGDGTDQNKGFYNTAGENTVAQRAEIEKAIREVRKKLLDGASNDRVKEMFGTRSDAWVERELGKIDQFTSQQRKVANDTVSQARINEAADDAAAAWNDPTILARSEAVARAEMLDMAERNGWAPEVINSKLQEANTVLFSKAVKAALVHDPAAAKALYEANKPKIDGVARAELEKLLESGVMRQQAQTAADEIMGKGLDESGALAAAKRIKDAKLRDEVSQRLRVEYADRARQERQQKKVVAGQAFAAVNGGLSLSEFQRQNPEAFEHIAADGPLLSSLQAAERRNAEGRLFAPFTDGKTLGRIMALPTDQLAEVNPDEVRHLVTQSEFSKVQSAVVSAQNRMKAAQEDQSIYDTGEALLKEFAPQSLRKKWGTAKEGDEVKNARHAAINEMNLFIDQFTSQGKKPTRTEMKQEVLRLFLKVETPTGLPLLPGGLFGVFGTESQGIAAQFRDMTPEERSVARIDVDNIPAELLSDIKAQIKRAGLKETEDLVEEIAGAFAVGDKARARALLRVK